MKVLIIQLLVNGSSPQLYALAGVTWGVIYRTTHIFHFAHHLVFAVAGYAAVMIPEQARLPYFFGFFAAVGAAVLVGCGMDARRQVPGLHSAR
jgi:branched-chain amino acid transport system permease protein